MKERKRALICGISGQEGAYHAHLLPSKGREVYGTSVDAQYKMRDVVRMMMREEQRQ